MQGTTHRGPPQAQALERLGVNFQIPGPCTDPGTPDRVQQRRGGEQSTLAQNHGRSDGTQQLHQPPAKQLWQLWGQLSAMKLAKRGTGSCPGACLRAGTTCLSMRWAAAIPEAACSTQCQAGRSSGAEPSQARQR